MMHNYSSMLEESMSRAENRARGVTEMLAHDSAEKSQSAVREIEKLRSETQAHTYEAIEELKSRFASLSDQIGDQLNNLTSRFSETSESVKDSTRRASMDLETTNTELRRQAKAIPETTRESATAMRKALQDQLAALDSLSDIANRHRYSGTVSRGEQPSARSGAPKQEAVRQQGADYADAPTQAPARRQLPAREDQERSTQRSAPQRGMPQRAPKRPPWEDEAAPGTTRHGRPAAGSTDDDFTALTAGLIDRLDSNARQGQDDKPFAASDAPAQREGRDNGPSRQPGASSRDQETPEKPAGEWSLGDLLARASEADDTLELGAEDFGGDDPMFGGDDQSYGRPPEMAPEPERRAPQPAQDQGAGADFNMKDIADAVDQDTVVEVWRRYNRGDRSVISREVYNRQGQSTFDQVQRRYRGDAAFRHIADRYMADFEKVLKDASKAGQDSKALQNYLVSETGKIYLMLAHASGRLD